LSGYVTSMGVVKIKNILEGAEAQLGINHIAGRAGMIREARHILVQRYIEEEGFWDRLIPEVTLIITPMGLSELAIISSESREKIFQTIISSRIPFVVLSQTKSPPEFMISFSEKYNIPVFTSMYDEYFLESRLLGLMREKINNSIVIHGSLVNVSGFGVIITGDSGTGKTECTRELVNRGHAWIADDGIVIEKRENMLYGRAHDLIKHCINIKCTGILDAKKFLGVAAVRDETVINLMVEFKKEGDIRGQEGIYSTEKLHEIMGVKLSYVQMPAFPHTKSMHRFVELIVKKLFKERGIA